MSDHSASYAFLVGLRAVAFVVAGVGLPLWKAIGPSIKAALELDPNATPGAPPLGDTVAEGQFWAIKHFVRGVGGFDPKMYVVVIRVDGRPPTLSLTKEAVARAWTNVGVPMLSSDVLSWAEAAPYFLTIPSRALISSYQLVLPIKVSNIEETVLGVKVPHLNCEYRPTIFGKPWPSVIASDLSFLESMVEINWRRFNSPGVWELGVCTPTQLTITGELSSSLNL